MPLRTLLFLAVFGLCLIGILVTPMVGIVGYMAHYIYGPERQWWAKPIASWGLRFSFMLAALTALSVLVHFQSLRLKRPFLTGQERLILLFLGLTWLSVWLGLPSATHYTQVDHPTMKMTKLVIFLMMMTHVVTTRRRLEIVLWVLVLGGLALGIQAIQAPRSSFTGGRLSSVGGVDFAESNFLPAFLAAILPIIGVQFLRSGWKGKLLCLAAGALSANAIILTRSRGAVLGLAVGAAVGLLLAPRQHRWKIGIALIVAAVGMYSLMDQAFIHRADSITASEENMDASSQGRVEIWRTGMRMLRDHPLGIGADNFRSVIGRYNPQYKGRDAHSMYVRCLVELGLQGFLALLALIVGAFVTLKRLPGKPADWPSEEARSAMLLISYGMTVGLAIMLTSSLFISVIYQEFLWWFLALPVIMIRVRRNLLAREPGRPAPSKRKARRPAAPQVAREHV
jgi:O-antigen ligase